MRRGLLFDMEYCVGCRTCTVACRQENDYDENTWGIKVIEQVYTRGDGRVQVDYLPFPTALCTLCSERIASAFDTKPSCVKHCPAACIRYGELDDLAERAKTMRRPVVYVLTEH